MITEIDIAISCSRWDAALEDAAGLCRRAVSAAFDEALGNEALGGLPGGMADAAGRPVEVSIVLADDAEVAGLNQQFRDRAGATNVLSFPAFAAEDGPLLSAGIAGPDGPPVLLGDVVLAFETIAAEAEDQGKTLADHVTHLVIHGIFHLLGYDHLEGAEAEIMEQAEIRALGALGVADPYAEEQPFVA